MSLLVLSASEVDTILPSLTPVDLQILMATVFSFLSSPTSYTPYRSSIQTQNHTALFMPARMANDTTVKLVCVPRDPSDTRGIPASTVVLDHATGAVKAIVNARNLTPIRNAAGKYAVLYFQLHRDSFPTFNQHRTTQTSFPRRFWSWKTNPSSPPSPPHNLLLYHLLHHHQSYSQFTSLCTPAPHRTPLPYRILPIHRQHPRRIKQN